MNINVKKTCGSLLIFVSLNLCSSAALAGISESKWEFSLGEIVTFDNLIKRPLGGGGDGVSYVCSKFIPKKVSFRITYDGSIPPVLSTGETGVQKERVRIINQSGKIMESFILEGIEKLEFSVWNGGGIYKIENISGTKLEGTNCTAGFTGLNDLPFDWESY